MNLGQHVRQLREQKGLLLREVAAHLEIDTAMISKIERGEKSCKREHVKRLADILDGSESELISIWLAEKVLEIVRGEKDAFNALKIVQKELSHGTK
ncbi:MAG: helix-turn-helix transcriptional regulator [Bacteroidota bacterium]